MRTTRFQKITAFLLAALMFFGGVVTIGAASREQDSNSELNSIRELLNAISYNEYQELDSFKDAVYVDEDAVITINGLDGVYTNTAGVVENTRGEATEEDKEAEDFLEHPREFKDEDGKGGLFIPAS